jgi:hypothetical protein
MTPQEFLVWQQRFFQQCADITKVKNNDYSPDSVVLGEVVETAFELGIDVPGALAVHLRKHWSALVTHFQGLKPLMSETIDGRLHDALNYITFLHLWQVERAGIVQAMFEVVSRRRCNCDLHYKFAPREIIGVEITGDPCLRCKFIHHLVTLNV